MKTTLALLCAAALGLDADDPHHDAVKFVVEVERGPLLLPVILLAEID